MLALTILDVKDFMSQLLIGSTFDSLWLSEANITTFCTFSIDGKLQRDFFDSADRESLEASGRSLILWKEVKPFCYSVIKGKQTPLQFKLVFQLSRENTEHLLKGSGLSAEGVRGLYLNFLYHGKELSCTTGTSLNFFTMDKTADLLWDHSVLAFFKRHEIPFLQL